MLQNKCIIKIFTIRGSAMSGFREPAILSTLFYSLFNYTLNLLVPHFQTGLQGRSLFSPKVQQVPQGKG